ncbi:MAG: S-methyl-5-thioribose-1-phosphate isomerase [Candidatus Krumholzibacteria bacterium]|nr:S-methyl-5-thioribose-1-phosphate isomerase [Candidatus Krumholzibacteria bacterium]
MSSLPFPFPVVGWDNGEVVLIDQTVLPDRLAWRRCSDVPALCRAIVELAVRGAPAIGVAAAHGLALSWHLAAQRGMDTTAMLEYLENDRRLLAATRPTAVNLFWALDRVGSLARRLVAQGGGPEQIGTAILMEARKVLEEDIAMCRALGRAGAELLPDVATVLTHCNAGGLATGGYGTAVGVVYGAKEAGKTIRVFADETRPLLQGARLTAWELADQGIDVTVICDSAAATVLRQGRIDAVITGADRIAANGDAANKIGTYPLAVLAARHAVPFYVAAPGSTFDPDTPTGEKIIIEERDPAEVHSWGQTRVTPETAAAWNPAFDVTPAELITAFITEHGVLKPPFSESLGPVLAR